jgi:spore coat polysaccharide biosynthesis predicted glycosyltransferase SpsG
LDPGHLLIRTDADGERGLGHLIRCLALGHAWKARGGVVSVATASGIEGARAELEALGADGLRVEGPPGSDADAAATRALAAALGAAWLVVDGDQFGPEFLRAAKPGGARLLLVDDFGAPRSSAADVVVNQNLGAGPDAYPELTDAQLLLGPRYILLRPEFQACQRWVREVPPIASDIFVFLGGSDPDGTTARVVDALAGSAADWTVHVVTGPYAPDSPVAAEPADARFRVYAGVGDMPGLMKASDLAIVAGGGTMWELLFMQVAVLSFARSPLQASVVGELARRGAVVDLGAPSAFDPERLLGAVGELVASSARRRDMAQAGRDLVDGGGADRVVSRLLGSGAPRRAT